MNNLKYIVGKFKNGLINSFLLGTAIGFIPNRTIIQFNDIKVKIPLPILTGFCGVLFYINMPFYILNYYLETTYVDNFLDKINIDRYCQYDGNNKKYPSLIIIKYKKIDIKDNN